MERSENEEGEKELGEFKGGRQEAREKWEGEIEKNEAERSSRPEQKRGNRSGNKD